MNVLVIAPHRDDEILGVGGTILKRKAAGDRVTVCVATASEGMEWTEHTKTIHREMLQAHAYCGIDRYIGLPFKPVILESYSRSDFNKALLQVVREEAPEEVYVPFWGDMQKDHRLVCEAAMVVLRAKYKHPVQRIYAYETLSETGINLPNAENAFLPNVFEDISDYLEQKLHALHFFASQMSDFPDLRSYQAVEALARLRGATADLPAAEAFMLIREIKRVGER
ncbi:MAG: PIG-L family deacetylase [Oscillospiraceae bacterium]|nr:PIG-L family deacetylase [Oscillospiraceae bacterium]